MSMADRAAAGMNGRPRLLFLSPVMPAIGGNGLAMRAGLFLDALAADFLVDLLVVPVADPDCGGALPKFVAERTQNAKVLGLAATIDPHFALIAGLDDIEIRDAALVAYPRPFLCRHSTGRAVARATALFGAEPYAALHVLRLYMAPFAAPFLDRESPPVAVLDLDEVESHSHRRLADLCRLDGDGDGAARMDAEAEKFAAFEAEWLGRFDRVLCSAETERDRLGDAVAPSAGTVVPNALAAQPAVADDGAGAGDRFLFVGSMGFAPNADAARYFCAEVWPAVSAGLGESARLTIVGSHPPALVRNLAARPGVVVTGAVTDVGPYYADADIAVVPLRAGGGTRIKVLEAFALGRPVIATKLGAEGLHVRHDEDIWLAEGPVDMAAACIRLAGDRGLRRHLAAGGRRTLAAHYDADKVKAEIVALYRPRD